MLRCALSLMVLGAMASAGYGQQFQRRATMVGGGSGDRGKCTIEVVVDGAAEVEIRGDRANLRNLSGQPAEWRRFECNAPLPANPAEFRFAGVDGRGRQELIRDPRQGGGTAVVRIEDKDSGREGYTFDLIWSGSYGPGQGGYGPGRDGYGPGRDGYGRDGYGPGEGGPWRPGSGRRMPVRDAIRVCQDSVQAQAEQRFRGARVEFLDTRIDDNPGRNDWVIGRILVRRGNGRGEEMRFNCSVDFTSGRVRSANIDRR